MLEGFRTIHVENREVIVLMELIVLLVQTEFAEYSVGNNT